MLSRFRSLVFFLFVATSALAAQSEAVCGGFDLDDNPLTAALYVVETTGNTHFIKDSRTSECPSAGPACRATAYLLKEDTVVVSRVQGNFACATFATYLKGKIKRTIGWLPVSSLSKVDNPTPSWKGHWLNVDRGSSIVIERQQGNSIKLSGTAQWEGINNNVNVGEFSATGDSTKRTIEFHGDESSYDCGAQLIQLGSYIVMKDNQQCGGMNVTFTGVYIRY